MAPNRKSPTLFTNSLESLNIPLKAEFLPLTDPGEAAQRQQQKCVQNELVSDPKTEKSPPTVSYWDWHPCDDTIEAEKVAAIDDLFSLSRLESNLIADSIRRETETSTDVPLEEGNDQQQMEDQKAYWDWSNDDVNVVEPDSESYAEQKVDNYHREECCDDYWGWHPNEEIEDEMHHASPSARLNEVVAESRKKFVRRYSHLPEPKDNCSISVSHHYWHWQELERASSK